MTSREDIEALTDQLVESYQRVGGINNIDGSNLPSKRAVAQVCLDLLRLLFPGYHDDQAPHSKELREVTGKRVRDLSQRLRREICRSLRLGKTENVEEEAHRLVCHFLRSMPMIREILRTDVEAAYEGDPAARNFEEIIVSYPSIETVAVQRMAHLLYLENLPLLPRMMTEWAHSQTGIDIHPGAQVGSHFFIDHGTGVVIGETCEIGSWVKLYHGVTLGAKSFQKDEEGRIVKGGKRHPTVRDRVTIYPGSTVLGGETVIGENSTIGGNVFLMKSIPPNSLVYYEEKQIRILDKTRQAERG